MPREKPSAIRFIFGELHVLNGRHKLEDALELNRK